MKEALVLHNKHWQRTYNNLYGREALKNLIAHLELRQIQVITGIRRSGKSTLFKLAINYLIEAKRVDSKSILYINLDDPYFSGAWKDARALNEIVEIAETITQTKVKYLFLDEIQNVEAWERFVKSAYDNERFVKIFITGSNSSLLEGEFATLLSGRYLKTVIFPPGIKEVLSINNINSELDLLENKHKALRIINEILEYGSYIEILKAKKEHKRDLLLNYYETIILKDCIYNNEIRDVKTFKELASYLVSNTAGLYSYNSLAKAIDSNENTMKDYVRILEDSFFISEVKQFEYSLKNQIRARKKTYVADNGLLAQTSYRFSKNYGKLFENLIYSELQKANYEVYFYNKEQECDFIAKKNGKVYAIQATFELHDVNKEREIKSLNSLKFPVDKKIIVTLNQKETISDTIKVINIFEFADFIA